MLNFLKEVVWFLGKLVLLLMGVALLITAFYWITKTLGSEERINMNLVKQQVEIILEESEENYVNRVKNLLYTKHDKNYKLTNHKIKFDRKEGSILVRVADSSLQFKYPHSLMVTTSWKDTVKRINSFYMTLALTPKGRIQNSEARTRIYELIQEISDAGWKRYLDSGSARISGQEVYGYNQEINIYDDVSLDDKYMLNDEEWMSLSTYNWNFYYKDKAYLDLKIMREQKGRKIDADEGYILLINIDTIAKSSKTNFKNFSDKAKWKELYPALLDKDKIFREESEKKAIKAGYHIDYQYKDSPLNRGIFDLSKQRDDFDENVTCTKTGYWQSYVVSSEPLQGLSKREGEIFFYQAGMVFLEKDEALAKVHNLLRWRFLGTKDEYDLSDGKLIKRVETQEGKKVSIFSEGDVCPKNGYWEAYLYKEKGSRGVAYFSKGEALSTNSNKAIAILFKWKYLGDESDFNVVGGELVRRV